MRVFKTIITTRTLAYNSLYYEHKASRSGGPRVNPQSRAYPYLPHLRRPEITVTHKVGEQPLCFSRRAGPLCCHPRMVLRFRRCMKWGHCSAALHCRFR